MARSSRLPNLAPSALSQTLASADGVDLTISNPTMCGFDCTGVDAALGETELTYAPEPLGLPEAREAVAAYARVPPARVVITASTSEAYAFLLKRACEPGGVVIAPRPSYPLIEHLARLESLEVAYYNLFYDGRWVLDTTGIERALRGGARVVITINPNNPTGSVLRDDEAQAVRALCAEHDALLVSDEVFAPYASRRAPLASDDGPLTVVLDGLSKAMGLPQLKLGWMVLHGPEPEVRALRDDLAWISDAYLSVATPIQRALPRLLPRASEVQRQIKQRVQQNRAALRHVVDTMPAVDLLEADGGWYGVLRVPPVMAEETLVSRLATSYGVKVHPGFFYDFASDGALVVSLLGPAETLIEGAQRLHTGLAELGLAGLM